MAADPHRYPIEALAEAMRESYSQACDRLGIGGGQRNRIAAAGGFTMDQAEHYANRAGFHPWNIWPQMIEHQTEGCLRTCACGRQFVPAVANQVTCGESCRRERRRIADRDRVRARVARPTETVCELPWCGTVIEQKPKGRIRRFCCDAHRQAAASTNCRAA